MPSVYKELLCQHTLPHLCKRTVETPIFMQDNTPCHKAKTVLSFLEEEGIAVINPIKNVWKIIEKTQNRNTQNHWPNEKSVRQWSERLGFNIYIYIYIYIYI